MEELGKEKKNTTKRTLNWVTYVFIVRKFTCHALSNHAHVHYPIQRSGMENLGRFCKKHGHCLSGKEIQATFNSHYITYVQQQTFCSDKIYKYIHLCICMHTFYYAYFPFNPFNVRLNTWFSSINLSCTSNLFFFTLISLL